MGRKKSSAYSQGGFEDELHEALLRDFVPTKPSTWTTFRCYLEDVQHRSTRFVITHFNRINWADAGVRGLALLLLSSIVIFMGALLYHFVSGAGWGLSVFNVYSILFNVPGASVTSETNPGATVVLNLIFLAGLLVFAVLIGMVAEEIGARLMSIRSGKGPLHLKGHILLLNWNNQIESVIKQLNIAQRYKAQHYHDKAIVVLADMGRAEMLSSIQELLKKKQMKDMDSEIYCRSGLPYRIQDLDLVSASEASIIILLYPEGVQNEVSAEVLKAATIASLSTMANFSSQSLIVQVPNEASDDINHVNVVQGLFQSNGSFEGSGGMRIVRLSEQSVIDRLVAQSSLQPGLCTIYEHVLRHGKDAEFVWIEAGDDLRGKFSNARRRFPTAVMLGYISSYDGELHLNPGDSDIITPGDKVILLAQGAHNHIEPSPVDTQAEEIAAAEANAEARVENLNENVEKSSKQVLVLGWSPEEAGELVAGFSEFSPPGTSVTFIVSKLHPDLNKYIKRTLSRGSTHVNRPTGLGQSMRIPPKQVPSFRAFESVPSRHSCHGAPPLLSKPPSGPMGSLARGQTFGRKHEPSISFDVLPDKTAKDVPTCPQFPILVVGGVSDQIEELLEEEATDAVPSLPGTQQSMEVSCMNKASSFDRFSRSGSDSSNRSVPLPKLSLSAFGSNGSSSLISKKNSKEREGSGEYSNINEGVQFVVGKVHFVFKVHPDPMSEEAMRLGEVDKADSVILGLPTQVPYPYSDSQVLTALLLVQNIAAETGHKIHVVAKVNNSNTKKVAKKFFENLMRRCVTYELLISNHITSAILTQVAWQPAYIVLVQELLVSSEGMELYIVDTARLGFSVGETTTFMEVTECARVLNYTVIGYSKSTGKTNQDLILGPPGGLKITIEEGDKFILLAEEWE